MKHMKYKLLSSDNPETLSELITDLFRSGFILYGSPGVSSSLAGCVVGNDSPANLYKVTTKEKTIYIQAMIWP